MDVKKIVFDDYVICPFCNEKMKSLTTTHLQYKHGYPGVRELKLEFGIPISTPLIAHNVRNVMREKGKRRAEWFRENVLPLGVEYSKQHEGDTCPKELRKHGGRVKRGKEWQSLFVKEMKNQGWIDLHEAANIIGMSYNYIRKCATDKRLQTVTIRGIRFTKTEWINATKLLLQENREKYRPDLLLNQKKTEHKN